MHLEYKRGILQFVFQLFLRELKGNESSKLICFYNSDACNNIALYTINIPEISNLSIYTSKVKLQFVKSSLKHDTC